MDYQEKLDGAQVGVAGHEGLAHGVRALDGRRGGVQALLGDVQGLGQADAAAGQQRDTDQERNQSDLTDSLTSFNSLRQSVGG